MACAIEDAGFEIRDQIMWLYGSGFPKSQNVSLAIDKSLGACGHKSKAFNMKGGGDRSDEFKQNGRDFDAGEHDPVTPEAQQWNGWGTALKPAHEPMVLARKPLIGTVAANVTEYGTGAINIDGCRVGGGANPVKWKTPRGGIWKTDQNAKAELVVSDKGRFPANVIHDKIDEPWAKYFYCPKASKADRGPDNKHPTVKPNELMRYLCRLITPAGGTVLDPFTGSGSTGKAALMEGFKFIGIERDETFWTTAIGRMAGIDDSDNPA
jgi:site-specific DNA-methyltransferase (adenine-specific)